MTPVEQKEFQLSTLKMTAEEAVSEYQKCTSKPWGVLLANRELPVLEWAKEWLASEQKIYDLAEMPGLSFYKKRIEKK